MKKTFDSYKLSTFIRMGEIRDDIMDSTKELNPELLVLGTRGRGLVKRMLLGSISDYCIHHSTIPVLIVPHPS
jgi:nucleotide-binding universal stress UspA family protein